LLIGKVVVHRYEHIKMTCGSLKQHAVPVSFPTSILDRFDADMDIAVPAIQFLRTQGVEVLSALEEGWGDLTHD